MNHTNEKNLEDQHLVNKVLRGDTGAFEQVIKNTERLVAQIIFKMVNNAEDRKDIAQDVYLRVFKNLSSFKFQSKLSTWIGQITYNTCFNYLEKKKLILPENVYEGNEKGEATQKISSGSATPPNVIENLIFKKELSNILKSEIEKLAPVYKTLITLFHNEELSYLEISDITQLPEGTVKNYLFRARKTLKENLLLNYKQEEL